MQTCHLQNGKVIGETAPCFVIAEIGINHNGDLAIARSLIDHAIEAGCDAVKFQKRTPEICVPRDQWDLLRETPWGRMSYIEYKHRIEFDFDAYSEIDRYCKEKGIMWFASCWDHDSLRLIESFNPALYKAASASLVDHALLKAMQSTGKPLIISTGMSTESEIKEAVDALDKTNLLIAHSTSAYPCKIEELNLEMIQTLKQWFPDNLIGYSGHETGLSTTLAAVVHGATFIERHFTLDRAMWGTDHAASVEPVGMKRLVRDIRAWEKARGDGIKRVYDSELDARQKLRKINPALKNHN